MTNVGGLETEMKDHFFYAAEHLFKEEKKAEAAPLYRYIIDRETDHGDQSYLLCQFRLFQCLVGVSSEGNKEALGRFEPFYSRLPEDVCLEAIFWMANVCYSLGDWKKVERFGNELYALAQNVYEKLRKEKFVKNLHTERHLVVYYGHGLRIKGFILTMQGRYEEAKECVAAYSDLGWFEFLDETGKKEVERFRTWSKGNMYALELKTGNEKAVHEYLDFLQKHPAEFLGGAKTIIESANRFSFNVDDVMETLVKNLPPVDSDVSFVDGIQLFHFWYEKAFYSFKKNQLVVGIDELLYALYMAQVMKYYTGFEKCTTLFWEHSDYATEQQKLGYKNIVEGVLDL
ncbi:DNA-binding protein [Paenibacillus sp. MZ04-78.2]|uniref:DNA-binding protein n=1 Tax=Paenibacillus sp. MZ04-78.2 TaxID=2962034 RepID=UPI0020B7561A|nr:DNA-binding protein [Paenibacillus sp. MZ04-78.2]MCP3776319.1 DNA-binding protein [Paenibacillus sp. MZ04-78.2]